MKIKLLNKPTRPFKTLDVGDVFILSGIVHIKVEQPTANHQNAVVMGATETYMRGGRAAKIHEEQLVKVINGSFTEEQTN